MQPSSGIQWIKKLSNTTIQFIGTKAYFTRRHEFNFTTNKEKLKSVQVNDKLLNVLSINLRDHEVTGTDLRNIFNNILLRSWVNWWTSVFNKRNYSDSVMMSPDGFCVDNVDMISEFIILNSLVGKTSKC